VTAVNPSLAQALQDRYLLERELGSGGMATVYLAQDIKHRRQVAVKVLRPELAASVGADRFLQEITTAARFQHPHILPLLDSGESGGFLYYVMPFVEGESLRRRLTQQGELPIHEAVKIMIEVCDALSYAHARGVVHRDIKPDNVLLSGRHALVTDFGVAKALSEATGRHQLTSAGIALGTPAYMAPEQAVGEPNIDHRVDIYALGILGYELVSGRTPFSARTSQEMLAAHVVQQPAPLCSHRPACPPGLEAVIMKCLAKRAADRWQSADELLAQLEPLATPSSGITPSATQPLKSVAPASGRRGLGVWLGVAAMVIALSAVVAFLLSRRPSEIRLGRRVQLTLSQGLELDPALSPDGKFVAYVAGPLGQTRLYVRQVDGGTPVAITPESHGFARMPRWSPDGQRLVFSSERGIELIPAFGGVARLLVPLLGGAWLDAAWSPDGRSIVYGSGDSVLIRTIDGGTDRGLAQLSEAHSCTWSPDGHWIACVSGNRQFVRNDNYGNIASSSVWTIPSAGGTPVSVTDQKSHNTSPAWLPGSLLYVSNRDGGRDIYQVMLTRSGRPANDAVRVSTGLNAATVSASGDGRRVTYATYSRTANVWSLPIPSHGSSSASLAKPVTSGGQEIEGYDVSADGRWLVFDSNRGGTQQIYRMPIQGGEVQQITSGDVPSLAPAFSPDGREIAYHSFVNGIRQLFVMPVEGGTPVQVTSGSTHSRIVSWSPDGRTLTFVKAALLPTQETATVSRDSNNHWGASRTFLKGGAAALWAHDGKAAVTLLRADPGRFAIVIAPREGGTSRTLVPPEATFDPNGIAWGFSADGRLVYYLAQDPESHRIGIWGVASAGGNSRPVVQFDNSFGSLNRAVLRVHGQQFYFSRGDSQSDIWLTEVSASR
jgi:eukaryotic-like serine/threonine-protein kinase